MKSYSCEQSDKTYSRLGNLNTHKRIHTGLKPYSCEQCDKSFSCLSSLNRHKRIHTGLKPYICEQCDKSFTQKCHLKKHKRIHFGLKTYRCDHYGGIIIHKRTHTRINARSVEDEKKKNKEKRVELRTRYNTKGRKSFLKAVSLVENEKNSEKRGWEILFCDKCNERFDLLGDLNRHIQENVHY